MDDQKSVEFIDELSKERNAGFIFFTEATYRRLIEVFDCEKLPDLRQMWDFFGESPKIVQAFFQENGKLSDNLLSPEDAPECILIGDGITDRAECQACPHIGSCVDVFLISLCAGWLWMIADFRDDLVPMTAENA